MTETQIEKAKRQYEQAKARLYATKARETKLTRKRDTRRKVILGGALMETAERDQPARTMMRRLIRNLSREQDRKMFDLNIDAHPDEANRVRESAMPNEQINTAHNQENEDTRNG